MNRPQLIPASVLIRRTAGLIRTARRAPAHDEAGRDQALRDALKELDKAATQIEAAVEMTLLQVLYKDDDHPLWTVLNLLSGTYDTGEDD